MKSLKAVFCIVFSFLVCFLCVGYAALNDTLIADGTAGVIAQTGVFITDVQATSGLTVNGYNATTLNSKIVLPSNGTATVDVPITVYNNSDFVYKFNGTKYLIGPDTYDNTDIRFEIIDMKEGDEIAANDHLQFTVRFSYVNSTVGASSILNSFLNFEFVPADEYVEEVAVFDALGKFKQILNTPDEYNSLMTAMSNYSSSGRADSSYIGNVVEGTSPDTVFLNNLFTDPTTGKNYLTLSINGKDTNVTAMIKNEELTTGGGEITIYLTAAELNYRWYQNATVDVYAVVFAKNDQGIWEQQGQLYAGRANANAYSGGWLTTKDSFNTDTWVSSQSYYGVASGSGIAAITQAYYNTLS